MTVVVVGSGGREHALAWRLSRSESVTRVIVSPGNPGMERDPGLECRDLTSLDDMLSLAPDLVVIGPEDPLVQGLADRLRDAGVAVVGPSAEAARLEGSKAFAKDFMTRHGVPTADYRVCTTMEEAYSAVGHFGAPVVVKADGLAAGKGVAVCRSVREAEAAIETMMRDRLFGDAGDTLVVEAFLGGFEASIIILVDESGYVMLPTSQDHKPIGEGNTGPNTGGMGVIAPNPSIGPELLQEIETKIVEPSVRAIQGEKWLFRGALFIGLMIDEDGPRALEYNVRFGDPETQSIMPLIGGDFFGLLKGLAEGRLAETLGPSGFSLPSGGACTVVAASAGYPGPYSGNVPIRIGSLPQGQVFFAGVKSGGDGLLTSGGRVLAITARGESPEEARQKCYEALLLIHFDGMQYRRDIGGPIILDRILEEGRVPAPQFDKRGGVLPVVVQDAGENTVLMVAYTNRRAFEKTMESGLAHFWSTSRNELWKKGETSGDYLEIVEVRVDCDQDALLYRVRLAGDGVCHTTDEQGKHRRRCFYRRLTAEGNLELDP
jgi:phosphoribosylamine---glycine ligase